MRWSPLLLLLPVAVAHAAPDTMVHSGRLLDAAGGPLNGARTLRVDLYADGASFWDESHDVVLQDGYFAVVLGAARTLPPAAFAEAVEIGVSVGGQALLRQPLHASPAAMAVTGAVRLTAAPSACDGATRGTLRMEGADLQVCDGTAWRRVAVEPASAITPADITRWDAAHGWGDHAEAGYLRSDTLTELACAPGQQARREGSGSGWRCTDVAPGANLVAFDDGAWIDEPDLVTTTLPNGRSGLAHRAVESGTGCYQWGVGQPVPVDPTKAYEFSVWIRSSGVDVANYLGFYAYDATGRVAGSWDNPYFKTSRSDPNQWVRWSGYLLPASTPATNGRPNVDSPRTNGVDWVMPAANTTANIRFGGCYGDGSGATTSWFAEPSVREVDPSEASTSGLRIYRDSAMAQMTSTASRVIPGLSTTFWAEAGTPVTLALYAHQRCNDSYFYNDLRLDGVVVSTAGVKGHTTWRVNNHILWNGTVATTGNHTVDATWEGGTTCSTNSGEMGAGGANVSITAWVGE
jgi:hypothetical protein